MSRHRHDCDLCVALGEHGRCDLYFCPQPGVSWPTLIARWGEHGDYWSWPVLGDSAATAGELLRLREAGAPLKMFNALSTALQFAVERGLVK